MAIPPIEPVSIIVPAGALGSGVSPEHIESAIRAGAVAVAVDAGSTDSGPSCLATGISKVGRDAIFRDLKAIVKVAFPAGIPVLVGSCGTSGTDVGVDWTYSILKDVLAELRFDPRIALLYSEQDKFALVEEASAGKIHPLPPSSPVVENELLECEHVVALMGPEPYIDALKGGAQIVLGGRTTDTAVLAAIPLMRGADPAHAWHGGKVAECGGLCTVNPRGGGVLLTVGADYFEVEPLAQDNLCTPATVSAHMLYENSDPFKLTEPGGILDVSQSRYEQISNRAVRVTGSRWTPRPYTMKLEGASSGPYQTIMLVGIEDPDVLSNMTVFLERMSKRLNDVVNATFPALSGWSVSLRPYGWNAVAAQAVPEWFVPREVGLLMVVTAEAQDMATRIAKALNSSFFHFPWRPNIPLPSYAYPFSPAEIERGQVHEFRLNHVIDVKSPEERVRIKFPEL